MEIHPAENFQLIENPRGLLRIWAKLVLVGLGLSWSMAAAVWAGRIPHCQAVFIVSGGQTATTNSPHYFETIERLQDIYQGCPLYKLVASGDEQDKVTYQVTLVPSESPNDRPQAQMTLNQDGLPILITRPIQGGIQGRASLSDLKRVVQEWTGQFGGKGNPDVPVIFYFLDHGSFKDGQSHTVLWGNELLSPQGIQEVLGILPEDQKVVLLFDHCYSGGMLDSLWDGEGQLRRRTCALASSQKGELMVEGGGIQGILHQDLQDPSYGEIHQLLHDRAALIGDPYYVSHPELSSMAYIKKWLAKQGLHHLQEDKSGLEDPIMGEIIKSLENSKQCQGWPGLDLGKRSKDLSQSLLFVQVEAFLARLRVKITADFKRGSDELNERSGSNIFKKLLRIRPSWAEVIKDIDDEMRIYQGMQKKLMRNHEIFRETVLNPLINRETQERMGNEDFQRFISLKNMINQEEEHPVELLKEFEDLFHRYKTISNGIEAKHIQQEVNGNAPPTQYYTNHDFSQGIGSSDPALIVRMNRNFKSMGHYMSSKISESSKKLNELKVYRALREMVRLNDTKSIEEYFQIVECEATPMWITSDL